MPFWPKNVNTRILSAAVTSCKESETCNEWTCYKTDRIHFGALFIQKHSARFFKKKKKKTKQKKNRKKKLWDTDFWQYIPEKPHFGPLLGHFWHKNLKTKFYQKTCIRSIVTLYEKKQQQKNKKIRSTNFSESLKTFWAYFCSSVLPILARLTLYFCNLMQKIKKFPWIIWAPKSLVLALSKVRWHPNFRQKKSGSFYEQFWGKTSDRQLKNYSQTG